MKNKILNFFLLFLFLCIYLSLAYPIFASEKFWPKGPFSIRNQVPLYLIYYFFPQESARVVDSNNLTVSFDYTVSNIVVDKVTTPTEEYIIRMDMEVNRFNLNLRYGLFDRMEMSLEIPYLVLSEGYLDAFVEEFEDLIGATSVGARRRTDRGRFNYNVRHNNRDLVKLIMPVDGIGDIVVGGKLMLFNEKRIRPAVSIRSALKFPTASEDVYLGNGGYDFGIGVLLDKSFGRFFVYFNLNVVYIAKPNYFEEFDMEDYILSGLFAIEYCITEKTSVGIQATWNSTPYPHTGTDPMDNDAIEVALGFTYDFGKNVSWHFVVVENTYADSSPDVTFQTGYKLIF